MKKIFSLLVVFATAIAGFAQTNLWTNDFTISETWGPAEFPVATITDGNINVEVKAQAGWQWGAQVKVAHGIKFSAEKYYSLSMTLTSDKECGGVTVKMDDNEAVFFADQSINLAANTPYVYSVKQAQGHANNNGILVFDFGYAAADTHITISNIEVKEVEFQEEAIDLSGKAAGAYASSGNAGAAIDGNTGTRWESQSNDNQWWAVNYGEVKAFNTVSILWEGAYGKSFQICGSNNGKDWTEITNIEDQTLAGFPYTQIIDLAKTENYQYVLFKGIKRGTPYGYSFWEFDTYVKQTDVLTSLDFTAAAAVAKVGSTIALTATPKNQYNAPMTAEVTYTVTPAEAGSVADGVYTALKAGAATITAKAGELTKEVSVFNYAGENLVAGKTATDVQGGFNDIARVNDGNTGSEWQGDPSNGTAEVNVTCGFTFDLGAAYDLELVTILFEGACSDAYTIETSSNNTDWNTAFAYEKTNGINGHTDYIYGADLQKADSVRYVKFTSTKNSTQWGMKIFEFAVYGTEAKATGINNVNASTSSAQAIYNIAGQRVANAQRGLYIINGKKVVK